MKKEEGNVSNENPAGIEGIVKEASPRDQQISKQQIQMLQKRAAIELADYKKRLRESVELKRLQTEELALNIEYFQLKKQYAGIQEEIQKMEAEEVAKEQEIEKLRKEAEEKVSKLTVVKSGKPRSEDEIKESLKE